jgi:sodium transport system permease protein
MKWSTIRLIFLREFRDQLRDRRTMFTIAVLPLLLYPLLGLTMLQVAQFFGEQQSKIWIVAAEPLPDSPPLVEDGRFAGSLTESGDPSLLEVTLDLDEPERASDAAVRQLAAERIRNRQYDAVVYFPPGFTPALEAFRGGVSRPAERAPDGKEGLESNAFVQGAVPIPAPRIITNEASERSKIAGQRVENLLRAWREMIVEQELADRRVPRMATRPFQLELTDVAPADVRRAAMWSKILPFVVLIWALTGAFYPAVDLCAGEKERGTLETVLCCPAERGEIVWGKLLTIMMFSMATAVLNLLSMGMTGLFVIRRLEALESSVGTLAIGPPPLAATGWLLLALIPISALFSALSLAIAAFARSSKEGQYYLMPLLVITLPLMMLSVLPAAELTLGTSLIPVTGMLLLLQVLVEGRYGDALPYVLPVVGVTALCCLLAIRWAINQFNDESVLFRDSERWGLRVWLRHLVRDRGQTPSFGEAMLCGALLLVIGFFASFMAPQATQWSSLATSMVILQVGLIATPALLMTIMLTSSPRQTLLLRAPRVSTALGALLLAISLSPLIGLLGKFVQWLYPLNRELLEALRPIETGIAEAPLWQVLLVVALVPAVCEELAYRGFVLSGLRHVGHKWTAIAVTSLFFGLAHGILQQKMTTCVIGVVIGYLAVQTGSLLPCVLFHFTNNALVVLLSRIDSTTLRSVPALAWLLRETEDGGMDFRWPVFVVSAVVSVGLLFWFRRLPYNQYEEERLQEAIEHQTASSGIPSATTSASTPGTLPDREASSDGVAVSEPRR